jgi:hypothetical protein
VGTAQHDGNAMHVFDARKDANVSVKSIVLGARKGEEESVRHARICLQGALEMVGLVFS